MKGNTVVSLQEPQPEGCKSDGNTTDHNLTAANTCRTKDIFSSLCDDKFANIALQLPWTVHQTNLNLHMRTKKANLSLVELLVRFLISISARVVIKCIFNIESTFSYKIRDLMLRLWPYQIIFFFFSHLFLTQDDSEVTSDEESGLTQDEIQAFLEQNQSFYSNRHQYRQLLKEKFTDYCRATERSKRLCGKWFATTSVK